MPATKRGRARSNPKSTKERGSPGDDPPAQTAQELELYGPRPNGTVAGPAQIFTVYGTGAYLIDKFQLVSLKLQATEADREAQNRQRLCINAGRPTSADPDAGKCFHADFGFTPKDSDVYELLWQDPKPLTFTLGDVPFCSDADALARYAGGYAFADESNSAGLFAIFFLNGGEFRLAAKAETGTQTEREAYARQRARILHNLRKMFLVFPEIVEPSLGPNGWPRLPHETTETVMKPMLGCFASIVSDKREGAPARNVSICGYHDQCRLHILPPRHLDKIRQLVTHFGLADELPPVWDNLEDGQAQLELQRERHVFKLRAKHPDMKPEEEAWRVLHSNFPFAKPWVQRCNLMHPNGETRDGRPVLVPLVRGGAEERNGVPWLYLNKDDDSAHAQSVRNALVRLSGRTPKRRVAEAEIAWATVRVLKCELAEADAQLAEAGKQLALWKRRARKLAAVTAPRQPVADISPSRSGHQ
tara:strand:+ start:332 stop:1753 length:1422 start_codon:yes stop_codon:yes gene_type:complete